jgi:osmotically-inducible protein OsmY
MKITQTIGLASAMLLAAGCAHDEHSAQYGETVSPSYGYSSSGRTEYNTQNNISSPSTSSTYSGSAGASGSYSTSNEGNYSGGISQGGQSQSDNTIVAQVRESLQRDPEIAFVVPNIQITANNGAIILSGSVQSEEQKRQILSKVQQVTGVVTVNNQLNITPGPSGGQGAGAMNPTSNSGSERLYKDAGNGKDNSTNNALNPTSRETGPSQLYRESNQGQNNTSSNQWQNQEQNIGGSNHVGASTSGSINGSGELNATSRTNGSSQLYQNGNQKSEGMNGSTNSLNSTSREGGSNQIFQGNSAEKTQNGQGMNSSTNSLNATSRENGSNQIYQGNSGQKTQDQNSNANTNSNQQINNQPMR